MKNVTLEKWMSGGSAILAACATALMLWVGCERPDDAVPAPASQTGNVSSVSETGAVEDL